VRHERADGQRLLPLAMIASSARDYMGPTMLAQNVVRKTLNECESEKGQAVSQPTESLAVFMMKTCDRAKVQTVLGMDLSLFFF
jgi:hypothetical protein